MTRRAASARGLVDPDTGAVVATTATSVWWFRSDGSPVEVTPDHEWACVGAGGGAVVMAGEGRLTWYGAGAGTPVRVATDLAYRVAVRGSRVAAVTRDGVVLLWRSLDQPASPLRARVDFEPDGVAIDVEHDRLAVWGWPDSGSPRLELFQGASEELTPVAPSEPWPAPAAGVAFPVAAGDLALAAEDAVVVVSAAGAVRTRLTVAGIEGISGAGSLLTWVRSDLPRSRRVVGTALLVGGALQPISEWPMPGDDALAELSTAHGVAVVLARTGRHEVSQFRLGADGWSEPATYNLARTASD